MATRSSLRLAMVGLISVVALVGCSTKTSCNTDPYTGGVTCTESQSAPAIGDRSLIYYAIFFLAIFAVLGAVGSVKGSARSPRLHHIRAGDLRPGDCVESSDGTAIFVSQVTWINSTQVRLTFTNGGSGVVDGSVPVNRLPR